MKVEIPTTCPSCESPLVRINDQLFCKNTNCSEKQIRQVVNYAKIMKIKGLGEKTVEKLGIQTVPEIYVLTLEVATAELGEKIANKLLLEIKNSQETELSKFLAACSIPLIGQTASNKVAQIIHSPFDLTEDICKKAGLGDKATLNLMGWFNKEFKEVFSTLPITFKKEAKKEGSITVCVTGKIPGYTKATLAAYLSKYNVSVVDNVSKKINYLVCDSRKDSTKEKKANELGIKIVNLEELKEIINV